jgi:hypothetical protein
LPRFWKHQAICVGGYSHPTLGNGRSRDCVSRVRILVMSWPGLRLERLFSRARSDPPKTLFPLRMAGSSDQFLLELLSSPHNVRASSPADPPPSAGTSALIPDLLDSGFFHFEFSWWGMNTPFSDPAGLASPNLDNLERRTPCPRGVVMSLMISYRWNSESQATCTHESRTSRRPFDCVASNARAFRY